MMNNIIVSYLIFMLFFTSCEANEDVDIRIECLSKRISLKFSEHNKLLKKYDATKFFISYDGKYLSPLCVAHQYSEEFFIFFPFQLCGMKAKVSNDSVIYSNSIWASTILGTTEKIADFHCMFGTNFSKATAPQKSSFVQPNVQNEATLSASLCKTPYFCPSRICPVDETLGNYAVYFEHSIMNIEIITNRKIFSEVAAIHHLYVSCGNKLDSNLYHSVIHGCQAGSNFQFGREHALFTHVNYNAVADTICLSVNTPPAKECFKYFVHGSVTYCSEKNASMCADESGMQCHNVDYQYTNFTFGPLYVISQTAGKGEIRFVTEATTAATEYVETTPANTFDEDFDIGNSPIEMEKGLETNLTNYVENSQKITEDEFDVREGSSDVVGSANIFNSANATTSSLSLVNKSRNFEEIRAKTEDVSTPSNLLNEAVNKHSVLQRKLVRGRSPKNRKSRKNSRKNQLAVKGVLLVDESNDVMESSFHYNVDEKPNSRSFVQKKDPETTVSLNHHDRILDDELTFPTEKNDPKYVLPKKKKQRGLGKFTISGGNDGFIWASVSALGLFLLLSIGILAAWTANKRKGSRRH